MNKFQNIVNKKWFPFAFFFIAVSISIFQHYRVFSLDIIGYHSWRQTQTQTVIENFAHEDFNILNPRLNDLHYKDRIYRMEFPLTQWLVAILYKLFGNHLIITRLFFYVTSLFSVLGIYKLIMSLTNKKIIALLTAWFFLFSPIIYFYSMNPIPDNVALCLGIWSLFFWTKYLKEAIPFFFIMSYVFLAFSMAIKLPFVVFGAMYLSKFFVFEKNRKFNFKFLVIPFLICSPAITWYIWVIGTWKGNGIVMGMIDNQTSLLKLLDILQFNVLSTLPELLVNYATFPLFIIGLYYAVKINFKNKIHVSFLCVSGLCVIYFLYELNMIDKVHDYYLFPFLPLLFIIIAKGVDMIISNQSSKLNYLILISFLLCPVTAYLRCNTRWNIYTPGFSKDYLFSKKQLQTIIPDTAKMVVYGDESKSIILYHLNRRGWSYGKDLKEKDLQENIKNGALYLISDCDIDTNIIFYNYTRTLIFQKGIVKLYKLK